MNDLKCEKVYVVYNNTDLTEGRGGEYVYAIAETEVTAERVAKGKGVQGTDCRIIEFETVLFDDTRYLPIRVIPFHLPTIEDINKQKERDEKLRAKKKFEIVLQKAKDLGLTDEEIAILKNIETGD